MIESEVAERKKTERAESQEIHRNYPFYRYGARQGLLAGLLMGIYLLVLRFAGYGGQLALDMLKYLILAAVLGYSLYDYRGFLPRGRFFGNGILLGLLITFVSAITLIGFLLVSFAFGADVTGSIGKFAIDIDTVSEILVLHGALFFEVLVFGMILTFIWLQGFKTRRDFSE